MNVKWKYNLLNTEQYSYYEMESNFTLYEWITH